MRGQLERYVSLAGAAALAQGFVLLVAPVVTRLYSPSAFGAFGLLLGIGAVVASVGTGRLEHAIPLSQTTAEAARIFSAGTLAIIACATLTTFALLAIEQSGMLSGTTWEGLPFASIPLLAIALAMFQLTAAAQLRRKAYRKVAANKLLQGAVTGTVQIVLGLLALAALGLVLAQAVGYLAGSSLGVRGLWKRIRAMCRSGGFRLRETFRRHRRFPMVLAPAALFNQASQQAPLLAIGSIFGLQEAGLYALTQRVCAAPLSLIGQSVAQVYASEFRDVHRRGGVAMANHYRALLVRLTLVGAPIVAVIVVILIFAGEHIFGREWGSLGRVALYLGVMLLSDFATTPVSMTLGYVGGQRLQLLWDIGRLLAIVLLFGFVAKLSMAFEMSLLLLSLVWAASLLVHAAVTYRFCRLRP